MLETSVPLDTLVAYAALVAGIVSIVVEIIKAVAIDPYFPDTAQRTAVLRGLNYLLNFGLLIAILAGKGLLNWGDLIVYLALAFGQSIGSHVVQQTFSGSGPVAQVAARFSSPKAGSTAMSASDAGGDTTPA